jgi:superfamily II DNA or RNA helicase
VSKTILRDYQQESIELIEQGFSRTDVSHRTMLVLPTGSGKTTVFSAFTERVHARNRKVLIVVHRVELVDQISKRLQQFGVDHGVIAANYMERRYCAVQVASIQTLSRRNAPPADVVIIDECHHAPAKTYKALWRMYPRAKFLGVTATPIRLNGEGFDDLFDELLVIKNLHWFFSKGYLVRPVHHLVGYVDTSNIPLRAGEFDARALQNVLDARDYEMDLLHAYQTYAYRKKGIAFLPNVVESMRVAEEFRRAGIRCAHVDGDTPKEVRRQVMMDFKNNHYDLLMNANLFGEGLDVPDIEVVLLGRPTASLALFKQQIGRAFRPSDGKQEGIVLDCMGLWHIHNCFAYDDHEWTLKGTATVMRESNAEPERIEMSLLPPSDDAMTLAEAGAARDVAVATETVTVDHGIAALGFDPSGQVVNMKQRPDIEGVRMVPVTENDSLRRLSIFENIVAQAMAKKYKLSYCAFEYKRYLTLQKQSLTDVEVVYIRQRLEGLGIEVKPGFWYHMARSEAVC